MTIVCPRCGEPLPADVPREPLAAPAGHHRVFKVSHRKANGRWCAAYVAPRETPHPLLAPIPMSIVQGASTE